MTEILVVSHSSLQRECINRIITSNGYEVTGSDPASDSGIGCFAGEQLAVVVDLNDHQQRLRTLSMVHRQGASSLVLYERYDPLQVNDCIQHGATGLIGRSAGVNIFVSALHMILAGQKVLPREHSMPIAADVENPDSSLCDILSNRERDVLHGLIAGRSNKAIARDLALSDATVKVHVKAILRKLGVQNRTQAALIGTTRLH